MKNNFSHHILLYSTCCQLTRYTFTVVIFLSSNPFSSNQIQQTFLYSSIHFTKMVTCSVQSQSTYDFILLISKWTENILLCVLERCVGIHTELYEYGLGLGAWFRSEELIFMYHTPFHRKYIARIQNALLFSMNQIHSANFREADVRTTSSVSSIETGFLFCSYFIHLK